MGLGISPAHRSIAIDQDRPNLEVVHRLTTSGKRTVQSLPRRVISLLLARSPDSLRVGQRGSVSSRKVICRSGENLTINGPRSPTRARAMAREGPEDLKDAAGPWRCPTRAVLA